jgi:hypothetical protein
MRTYSADVLFEATKNYETHGFYPEEWIKNEDNVALINNLGDLALFERQSAGVVYGHYFFNSRGKDALKAAKEFLYEIFTNDYDVKVIIGLTPEEHLGARWLNRKLGLKSQGILETFAGPHELVILTKQDWVHNE